MARTFVYVAGPYKGKTHDWQSYNEIDINIAKAREVSRFLAEHGIPYFCPHANTAHMEVITPELPVEYWYEMDNLFVDLSSAVFLITGWAESFGTVAEIKRARAAKKPVFFPQEGGKLVAWWWEEQKVSS